MSAWEFTLEGHPPSPNAVKGHWTARWKEAQLWKQRSAWMVRKVYQGTPLLYAKVLITLEYKRKPFKDLDNAYASIKYVLDGLKTGGIIKDDAPRYIDLTVKQTLSTHKRVRVHIEEAEQHD